MCELLDENGKRKKNREKKKRGKLLSEIGILAVCFQLKQLKKQPEKNSGLNNGAMLYPLSSYQVTWIDSQL